MADNSLLDPFHALETLNVSRVRLISYELNSISSLENTTEKNRESFRPS